jgi:hypothetical protein
MFTVCVHVVCGVYEVCGEVCVCVGCLFLVSVVCCAVREHLLCCTVWCVYVMCAVSLCLHVVFGLCVFMLFTVCEWCVCCLFCVFPF